MKLHVMLSKIYLSFAGRQPSCEIGWLRHAVKLVNWFKWVRLDSVVAVLSDIALELHFSHIVEQCFLDTFFI